MERFVLMDTELVWDMRRKAPGRGAHVHARKECLSNALRSGFSRAFRQRVVSPELQDLCDQMIAGLERRREETLRLAVRARQASVGQDAVKEAMRRSEVELLLLARDAGVSTSQKYRANASRKEVEVLDALDGARLGAVWRRDFVAVMSIHSAHLASSLSQDTDKLEILGAETTATP